MNKTVVFDLLYITKLKEISKKTYIKSLNTTNPKNKQKLVKNQNVKKVSDKANITKNK